MASNTNSDKPTPPEILKWMKDLNDWYSVGEKLGVRYSKLTALENKYPVNVEKAREELVDLWLEKEANPTWARLADAFDYAGQRALAKRIRETYNCPKKPLPERKFLMVGKPGKPTNKSVPKKPTQPVFPETSYRELPPAPPISPIPYRMPRLAFDCACGRFTPMVVRIAISDARRKPKLLPYSVGISHLALLQLKQDSDGMVARLGSFMNRFLISLKSRSVSLATLMKCLQDIEVFTPAQMELPRGIQVQMFEHRLKELRSMRSVEDVILAVSDYISFFNPGVLELLVGELGTEEDKAELETFLFYCSVFSKRSVYQAPSYVFGYLRLRTECMVVIRADDRMTPKNGISIQQLFDFFRKISDIMNLKPYVLHCCQVDLDPGGRFGGGRALEIVFRLPPPVVHEIFPVTTEQEKSLKSLGINHLHTIHYCFPPKRDKDRHLPEAHLSHKIPGRVHTGRKSGNQRMEESLSSRLRPCCGFHSEMARQRSLSLSVVTGADTGYDGDSDSSSDETAPLEPIPVVALRPSYQKRLMWRLANSYF